MKFDWITAAMVIVAICLITMLALIFVDKESVETAALMFVVLTVIVFCVLMLVGVNRGKGGAQLRNLILVGIAGLLALVTGIVTSEPEEGDRILGMLPATAMVTLGLWLLPLWFVACYVAKFRGSVIDETTEARLAEFPSLSDPENEPEKEASIHD
ncbi:MAG: hypothetical protein NUW37_20070 [Planctomycetes bacterium]|nr:hypothetical protein [Planctomycetota bacterium]